MQIYYNIGIFEIKTILMLEYLTLLNNMEDIDRRLVPAKNFGERLVKAMYHNNISKYRLAKDCGLSPSTISNWILGITEPDKIKVSLVSKYLDVNLEWLISGNGNMRGTMKECFLNGKEDIKAIIESTDVRNPDFLSKLLNIPEKAIESALLQDGGESIIQRIKSYLSVIGLSNRSLAEKLNMSEKTLNNKLNGTRGLDIETLQKIILQFESLNVNWLITGKGEMLNPISDTTADKEPVIMREPNITYGQPAQTRPRIPYAAAAGALTSAVEGIMAEQCEQIPRITAFPDYDFTIIIKGNSMEPKYEGGDEVACKRVDSTSFIQWGKVHVMDTAQGIVIKRVYEDGDKIRCVSYNPEYPDFSMEKDEIYSMSLVVGLLRM